MAFNVNDFKDNVVKDGLLRTTQFQVSLNDDSVFSFFISSIEIKPNSAVLKIIETESFGSFEKLQNLKKLDQFDIVVDVFSPSGDMVKQLKGKCSNKLEYETKFDWADVNNTVYWTVTVPVVWEWT